MAFTPQLPGHLKQKAPALGVCWRVIVMTTELVLYTVYMHVPCTFHMDMYRCNQYYCID